jgi:Na+/proline symporter
LRVFFLIGYAALVGAISWRVSRTLRGTRDFLMGETGLGVWQGVGLLGGIFVAATAVGVVGEGYTLGWPGATLDAALGLGFAVLLVWFLPQLRAGGHASVGALIRHHYGEVAGLVAAVTAGAAWLTLLAAFLASAARALAGLTGWSETAAIVVTTAVLLLYAMPGGMRAVAASNLVQLAALGALLLWTAAAALGHTPTSPAPDVSLPIGYLVAVTLLSTPTTVVAPDVILGVMSLADARSARRTLGLVIVSLVAGGLFLALLGGRAARLVDVENPEQALPVLIETVLPGMGASAGLVVLFGASLAGAVSELLVCTFVLREELRRRSRAWESLPRARGIMAVAALLAGSLAVYRPQVVEMVLMAFRIYVPALVPQAVAALVGWRPRRSWTVASMVAGPVTALGAYAAAPGARLTAAEPVLWGLLAAGGLLVAGVRHRSTIPTS